LLASGQSETTTRNKRFLTEGRFCTLQKKKKNKKEKKEEVSFNKNFNISTNNTISVEKLW
jgi:hypothetical protein